ncbi:MAG: sialate O-acetylesterase [Pseudomonadota bacterium]
MTVIYSDSFDGPDGEPLDGRVTTGGGAWELFGNTSRLELTGTGGLTRAFQSTNGAAVLDAGTTDHYVKFEGVDRDSDHYLVCCFVDLDNHVQLRLVSGGGWQLDTEVGGVNRNVATVDVAADMLATGNVLTLVRDPVAKTVGFTLNGTYYGPFTVGDAVFDTATKVGFWGRRPVATMATAIELGANDDGGPPVPDPFGGDDIVICAGQSNMQRQFIAGGDSFEGEGAWRDGDVWSQAPIRGATFANMVRALTGRSVGLVDATRGGTRVGQFAPAHVSGGEAIAEGTYWPLIRDAVRSVQGNIAALRWNQGEQNVGNASVDAYERQRDALTAIIAEVRAEAGDPALPVLIEITGRNPGGSADDEYDRVRRVQADVAAGDANVHIAADLMTQPMTDAFHLTTAGYQELGRLAARSYARAVHGVATRDGLGPQPGLPTRTGDIVSWPFALNGHGDLITGGEAPTGFIWRSDGAWQAATNATVEGEQVVFTAPGATEAGYLIGADPDVTNVLRGDQAAGVGSPAAQAAAPSRGAVAVELVEATIIRPSTSSIAVAARDVALGSTPAPAVLAARSSRLGVSDRDVVVTAVGAAPILRAADLRLGMSDRGAGIMFLAARVAITVPAGRLALRDTGARIWVEGDRTAPRARAARTAVPQRDERTVTA